MKILIAISSLECGGAESHVVTLARELVGLGHRVTVASSGGKMTGELENCGVRHALVPFNGRSPVRIISSYLRLLRLTRMEDFDIIHSHTRLASFICGRVARKTGIPLVTTVHARFSVNLFYRRIAEWGRVSIAVSEDLRHYLCKNYGVSSENTVLTVNGIDTDRFFFSPHKRDGILRLVFVSRMDDDCSSIPLMLTEIAPVLKQEFPSLEIYVCGGGSRYHMLSKRASGLDYFFVLGNVDRVEDVLRGASVFIGVSRAAMEAMACGVPTVLGGDEGYFGVLRCEEELTAVGLGNFCCRGLDRVEKDRLLSDIRECLLLNESERQICGRMLSRYIFENHSAVGMAQKTLSVYERATRGAVRFSKRILLCGYYGFGNMGDNALLRASICRVSERFGECTPVVLTHAPKRDSAEFNVRCIKRTSVISILREMWGASALVFGGGTLLQDGTSLRSLVYYSSIIGIAGKLGVRTELWGNGLENPRSRLGSVLMRRVLKACSYIGLRDGLSIEIGRALVGGGSICYDPDLALTQPLASRTRVEFLLERYNIKKRPFAVVAVKGSGDAGSIYLLRERLKGVSQSGIALLFVPMFPDRDMEISHRICCSLGGILADGISESDMTGLARESVMVIGMRLHALIFAVAAGTPFVGIGDDPKIKAFCKERACYCIKHIS